MHFELVCECDETITSDVEQRDDVLVDSLIECPVCDATYAATITLLA